MKFIHIADLHLDTPLVSLRNNRDLIKKVWLCHLSAENNVPRIAYETCAEKLAEAGYILNGENRNVSLEVLARQTPSLLTDL